jgi:hypothetical protein
LEEEGQFVEYDGSTRENTTIEEKKNWIRVPNIDNIDIIPGEKMLVWMKQSEPVFGRANETPEEVLRKWTKVFAPDQFYPRVNLILK